MGDRFDDIVDEYEGLDEYLEEQKAALWTLNDDVLSGQNSEQSQTTDEDFDDLDDDPPDLGDEGWEDGWNPEGNNWQNDWLVERWWDKEPTLTAKLLEGTKTEEHLLNILKGSQFSQLWETPEKRLDTIFKKVHTTVNSYLRRQFNILESSQEHDFIDKTVSPAIEWFLLETLRQGGNEGNNNALEGVLDVYKDMKHLWSIATLNTLLSKITGITKNVNGIYSRVKRIQKVIDCFTLHQDLIDNRNQYKELSNPYEFYTYLEKGELWNKFNDTDLKDVTIAQLWLTAKEETDVQTLSEEQKQKLLAQLWNIAVQENPKTTKNILKVLDTGEEFLTKSWGIKQQVLELARVWNDFVSQFWWNLATILDNPIGNFFLSIIGFPGWFSGLMVALNGNPTAEGSDQTSENSEKTDTKKDKLTKEIEKIAHYVSDPDFAWSKDSLNDLKQKLEALNEEDSTFDATFDQIRKEIGKIRLQCKEQEIKTVLSDSNMNWSSAETDLENVKQKYQELNKKIADEVDSQDQNKLSWADLSTQIDAIDLDFEKGKLLFLKGRLDKDAQSFQWNDKERITNLLGKCEDIESKSIEDIQWLIKSLILFIQEKDSTFVTKHSRLEKYLQERNDDTELSQSSLQNTGSSENIPPTGTIDGQTGWTDTKYPNGLEKYDGKWKLLFEDSYLKRIGVGNIWAFKTKLQEICKNDLWWINPNWFMLHIFHESGFNPQAKNKTSWALWLIQILPKYVEKYGTTLEKLEKMSAIDQLDIVKNFFQKNANKIHSYEDIALLWFAPAYLDQKNNPDFILYSGWAAVAKNAYDTNHDGKITMKEFLDNKKAYIQQYVPSDLQNQFIAPQQKDPIIV